MRSSKAFWASVIFLSAVPSAFVTQVVFGDGAAISIHLFLAAATGLLSLSVFDFAVPAWARYTAFAVAGSLSIIFLLQAVAEMMPGGHLSHLAFAVFGGRTERLLGDGVMLWLLCVLLFDSDGWSRSLGIVTLGAALAVEVYAYSLDYSGTTLDNELPVLKVVTLIPFIWLLIESRKVPRPNP